MLPQESRSTLHDVCVAICFARDGLARLRTVLLLLNPINFAQLTVQVYAAVTSLQQVCMPLMLHARHCCLSLHSLCCDGD